MLERYVDNFHALGSAEVRHLASALHLSDNEPLTGSDLYQVAESAGMDHATIVLSLAQDASVTGVRTIETLLGHAIVRRQSAPRTSAEPKQRRPRQSTHPFADHVITYVMWPCPKKPGSAPAGRYSNYKVGMTASDAVAAGLTYPDIDWDSDQKRQFIKLVSPEHPEAIATRKNYSPQETSNEA